MKMVYQDVGHCSAFAVVLPLISDCKKKRSEQNILTKIRKVITVRRHLTFLKTFRGFLRIDI